MPQKPASPPRPTGGLRPGPRTLRRWTWREGKPLISNSVRCRGDACYLVRVHLADGVTESTRPLLVHFGDERHQGATRCVDVRAPAPMDINSAPASPSTAPSAPVLLGWVNSPPKSTHVRIELPPESGPSELKHVEFVHVSERDPKCHPAANVPRWTAYQPPCPLRRLVLPAELAPLASAIDWAEVMLLRAPASVGELRRAVRGAAAVLAPDWLRRLDLSWDDLLTLAREAWLLVDLQSAVERLGISSCCRTELKTYRDADGIMSARVEYADVPTRGFALQDVLPFSFIDARGRFCTRVLRATRSWRAYAAETGLATLLSSETPWAERHADVLSAARPTERGELLMTDLPWLVAGTFGPLLAPRLATRLLHAHLGAPVADHLQHWNPWEDGRILVRDLADFARRYPPLMPVRWRSGEPGLAHLGITLSTRALASSNSHAGAHVASRTATARHLLISTGRIDRLDVHDGVPAEPMMIALKWLAREVREATPWAARHLADLIVTWQFDTAEGHYYLDAFDSAAKVLGPPDAHIRLRRRRVSAAREVDAACGETIDLDEGLLGDASFECQQRLTRWLIERIERIQQRG